MNHLYLDSDSRATAGTVHYPKPNEKRRYINGMGSEEIDDPPTKLAGALIRRELERGITQTELAHRMGVAQSKISDLAKGKGSALTEKTGPPIAVYFKYPHWGAFVNAGYEAELAVTMPVDARDRAAVTATSYGVLGDAIARVNATYSLETYGEMDGAWWLEKYLAAKADEDRITRAAKIDTRAKKAQRGKQLEYHREVAEARAAVQPAPEKPAKKPRRRAS